jgi:hypothetical protein
MIRDAIKLGVKIFLTALVVWILVGSCSRLAWKHFEEHGFTEP